MAGMLDLFAIGFNSEGIQTFEKELKNNERELDKYEKEVKKLENELAKLCEDEEKNAKAIIKVKAALNEAKYKADQFGKSVKTMQGKSEYALLQLKKNFTNLTKTLGMLAMVGVSVKKSLDFYEQGEQLQFLADKTGIAVEKLQSLGNAAKKYGGTPEDSAGTVENIRANKDNYKKAGIQISGSPEKTLENVAQKMETLKSDAEKWDLANSLGIDEGTTRLLIQGVSKYNDELKKADKYKLFTKEDIERIREYRQVQSDIKMGIDNIFGSIWRLLLPAISAVTKVIRVITDWVAEHSGAVKIVVMTAIVVAAIMGVIGAVKLLNVVTTFLFTNPYAVAIIAIIAAIAALIAIVQDFIVFLQGGETIIGDILNKMGVDTDKLRTNINNFFQGLKNWVVGAINWLKSLGGKFTELAEKIKAVWDNLPEAFKNMFGGRLKVAATANTISTTIAKGQDTLSKYNASKQNAVPAGATSNYYQTQSINDNSSNNAKSISNSTKSTKNVNIQKVEIKTQAKDGQDIKNAIEVMSELDNGMSA